MINSLRSLARSRAIACVCFTAWALAIIALAGLGMLLRPLWRFTDRLRAEPALGGLLIVLGCSIGGVWFVHSAPLRVVAIVLLLLLVALLCLLAAIPGDAPSPKRRRGDL